MDQDKRSDERLALLIDAENVPAKFAAAVIGKARTLGTVVTARAYGHFDNDKLKAWRADAITSLGIVRINISQANTRKNSADFKLVIEAMDMVHGWQLDGFCIASSDGDFLALAERIRANTLSVYGFGVRTDPDYKALFDHFYDCDTLLAAEKKEKTRTATTPLRGQPAAAPKSAPNRAASKEKSRQIAREPVSRQPPAKEPLPTAKILRAVEETKRADGWSHQGAVGNAVRKAAPGFTARKYGYKTMSALIAAIPEIISENRPDEGAFVRKK